MANKKIQIEKLKKLAKHLLCGNLKYDVCINKDIHEQIQYDKFTEARELFFQYVFLEASQVFPKSWSIDSNCNPVLKGRDDITTTSSAMKFFGIDYEMFCHICMPGSQNIKKFGGKKLTKKSRPADIAFNILFLIKEE